jgi:Protein of unknown function (DUF1439)
MMLSIHAASAAMFRRLFRFALLCAGSVLILGGCASNPFLPKELTMSAVELTSRLEKRFPVERTAGGLVDLTISRPLVTLEAPRMVTRLDVKARLAMSSSETSGSLVLSGIPHYDSATRGLYLKDARVEKMNLDRVPDTLSTALSKVATQLVKSQFEEKPFHTFKPEDFTKFGIGYEPLALQVRDSALVLTLKR